MPTEAHAITRFDWPTFQRLMADYRAGRLGGKPAPQKSFQPAGRSNIRAILLEDLESGGFAQAAVTEYQSVDEVQEVSLVGTITGGTWQLIFDGQTTSELAPDASSSDVAQALWALSNINPGDVDVTAYSGRYVIQFTGQYAGADVPLMTSTNSLTGAFNAVRISNAFSWVDARRTESIHCQLPVGTPTPLVAGVVLTATWLPAARSYGIMNVECRDLELDLDGYYGG